MPCEFYSGTKSLTGGALFVSFNSKDQAVYFRVIKQTGWNEQISKPTFAGGPTLNLKLSPDETGEFIHAINGHDSCKFYHKFKDEVTMGNFTYYEKEYKGKDGGLNKTRGFGLTIKKGELEAKIGFSLGGAERLSQYLRFALTHMFNAIYAQDKKEFEEYQKKKNGEPPKRSVKPKEPDPEPENTDDITPPEVVVEEDTINW